jgi:hypothetical protein
MREFHVLNLGAGVQSTTLYLMYAKGLLTPQIDCAVFADTQEEPKAVYEHLTWLQSIGGPTIHVRTAGKLGDDLVAGRNSTRHRFASIPAFTLRPDGSDGQIRRQCSREYKIEVIERFVRRELIGLAPRARFPKKTVRCVQYIGISLDEAGRASRITRNRRESNSPFEVKFPLIEHFLTRANCLEWLMKHGEVPHETPRSACVFCPYHSDYEWERLQREDPIAWQRAVEIDRALRIEGNIVNRNLDQEIFLHRSCVPLELVQLDTRPDPRKAQLAINFASECMGVCGV